MGRETSREQYQGAVIAVRYAGPATSACSASAPHDLRRERVREVLVECANQGIINAFYYTGGGVIVLRRTKVLCTRGELNKAALGAQLQR
jgi:hypothetical protein